VALWCNLGDSSTTKTQRSQSTHRDKQFFSMSINSHTIDEPLPREMQQHTYAIMRRVEESHWWFVGRRAIIRSFLERLVRARLAGRAGSLPASAEAAGEL